MRTSSICRGVRNPIGLKCGPIARRRRPPAPDRLLNPKDEPGRLTLICRFGYDKVETASAEAHPRRDRGPGATSYGRAIPCTATRSRAANGYKTRPFDRILKEVESFFEVHRAEGTHAGGIHVEMTGQNVTECTGGATAISRPICRTAITRIAIRASTPISRWSWRSLSPSS